MISYLDNGERALVLLEVDIDLEVSAGFDWLRVEVPRDGWLRVAAEHDLHDDLVAVIHALVAEREGEARSLLVILGHFKRHLQTRTRRHGENTDTSHRVKIRMQNKKWPMFIDQSYPIKIAKRF